MDSKIYTFVATIVMLICLSCGGGKEGFVDHPKGYFEEWKYSANGENFATEIPVITNGLKKITDGPISYYSWKTIKTDILIDSLNNEYFSAYRTTLLSDFDSHSMEGRKYLRTVKKMLNNYLFILDDRRLIYISEDGARFDNFGLGELNLMFLESDACKVEEKYGTYSQAVRGYYNVDGNSMQIHFKGRKDFFVKAIINEDFTSLSFDKISIGSESIDNDGGLRNRYEEFSKIFSDIAQPVFESPVVGDAINDKDFFLNVGIVGCGQMNEKLMARRNDMLTTLSIADPSLYSDRIIGIRYDINPEEFRYERHYDCKLVNFDTFEEIPYTFVEDLTDMITW